MKLARLLILFLLVAGLLSSPALAQRRRHHRPAKSGKVAALQSRLSDLRRKKQAYLHQLHANKALTHRTLQEIAQVDQQLGQVEDALQQTGQQLADSRVKQKQVAGE